MPIKAASFSTLEFVSQCLFENIELENALPPGLAVNFGASQKSVKPFDPEELRDAVFKTLSLLERRLCERVSRICQQHNSLLPIQRLPPEILSACIAHAMSEIETYNHQRRLIHLSSVSRWWRTVILDTPSLWGVISSKDPERIILLALPRSKDAPLVVVSDDSSSCSDLYGREPRYRRSIGSDDFFNLVGPHSARRCEATLPNLKRSSCVNGTQLSRHLQHLTLSGSGTPSTDDPITRFYGRTERLLELKLHQLVVSAKDIITILASSHRMISLDLQSLVVPTGEGSHDDSDDAVSLAIDLPCLTSLNLKCLPSSVLYPTVRNISASTLRTVHIVHDQTAQGNTFPKENKSQCDPFGSFIARVAETQQWYFVELHPNKVTVRRPSSQSPCQYNIELLGAHTVLLPWLKYSTLPQVSESHLMELYIGSNALGENPDQAVIETLKQFPRVVSVCLRGQAESWRWIWLLSLPDAVKTDTSSTGKTVGSWLWPRLRYLNVYGDFVDEFTVLSILRERHSSATSRGSSTSNDGTPRQLIGLEVRPGDKEWRADVLDRIRGLLKRGYFKWVIPK